MVCRNSIILVKFDRFFTARIFAGSHWPGGHIFVSKHAHHMKPTRQSIAYLDGLIAKAARLSSQTSKKARAKRLSFIKRIHQLLTAWRTARAPGGA